MVHGVSIFPKDFIEGFTGLLRLGSPNSVDQIDFILAQTHRSTLDLGTVELLERLGIFCGRGHRDL